MKKYSRKNLIAVSMLSSAVTASIFIAAFGGTLGNAYANSNYNCDVNGDGTVNVMDLNILKYVVLNNDNSYVQEPEPSPEPSPEPEPSPSPEPEPLPEPVIYYPESYIWEYNEIIDTYYMACMGAGPKIEGFGGNWFSEAAYSGTATEKINKIGYALRDITDDGIPELILGNINSGDKGHLGVVYSYSDDKGVVEVLESWSRNWNFLLEDNSIDHGGSAGAAYSCFGRYTIDRDTFEEKYSIFAFSEPKNTQQYNDVRYYKNTTGEWDSSVSEEISYSEYEKLSNDIDNIKRANIDYIPLSEKIRSTVPIKTSYLSSETKDFEAYNLFEDLNRNTVITAEEDITSVILLELDQDKTWNPVFSVPKLEKGHSIAAGINFIGDVSYNNAVLFVDKNGMVRVYYMTLSGKDGSVLLIEEE